MTSVLHQRLLAVLIVLLSLTWLCIGWGAMQEKHVGPKTPLIPGRRSDDRAGQSTRAIQPVSDSRSLLSG